MYKNHTISYWKKTDKKHNVNELKNKILRLFKMYKSIFLSLLDKIKLNKSLLPTIYDIKFHR